MYKKVATILECSVGAVLFAVSIPLLSTSISGVNDYLQRARVISMNDEVFAQEYDGIDYQSTAKDYEIISELLSRPAYRVTISDRSRRTTYRCVSDGSVLVIQENRNATAGVDGKKTEVISSVSDIDVSEIYGEYEKKFEYADSGRLTEVVYTRRQ